MMFADVATILIDKLVILQTKVRPFDFQLFLRIVDSNEQSLKVDDEPIFVVGPTRVGKVSVNVTSLE